MLTDMAQTAHGWQIDRLLSERGLSLLQLAERIAMDPSQLRKIKNRTSNPTRATLERIAAGLEVDVAELLRLPTDDGGAAVDAAVGAITEGSGDPIPAPRRADGRSQP